MKNIRLIARMDVKDENLVKGIQYEGLRKLGNPNDFAKKYYEQGIDEIIYIDIVASLYERCNLKNIVRDATKDVFVPITVGGGIRSLEDACEILNCGADKIAINTAAIKDPNIIEKIANQYGAQCMVLSIQAKRQGDYWEAYYDNGRERTGIDVMEWIKRGYNLGAGEIMLTSVDCDGTQKGFDVELVKKATSIVPIPVIACGGLGSCNDFVEVVNGGHADAVAVGSVLHYEKITVPEIKKYASINNINVRI